MLNLVDYGRIRVLADRLGVESIDRQGSVVVFKFKGQGGQASGPGPGAPRWCASART